MSKQTTVRASKALNVQASKAPKAKASNVTHIAMTDRRAESIAANLSTAIIAVEGAIGGYMAAIVAQAKGVPAMTEATYNQTVGIRLTASLNEFVGAGRITKETAASRKSQVKTSFLAIVNGLKPEKGESLKPFSGRASEFIKGAKVGSEPVLKPTVTGKAKGRPSAPAKGKGGKGQGALKPSSGNASPSQAKDAFEAACMILAAKSGGSSSRAQRLAFIFASKDLSEQFDTWAATVQASDPKANQA